MITDQPTALMVCAKDELRAFIDFRAKRSGVIYADDMFERVWPAVLRAMTIDYAGFLAIDRRLAVFRDIVEEQEHAGIIGHVGFKDGDGI